MEHGHSTFVPRLYRVVITCISVCTACKRGRPRYRRASPAIRTRNSRRRLFRGHTTGKPRVSQFCTFSTTGNGGQKKIAKFYPRYRRERLCDRAFTGLRPTFRKRAVSSACLEWIGRAFPRSLINRSYRLQWASVRSYSRILTVHSVHWWRAVRFLNSCKWLLLGQSLTRPGTDIWMLVSLMKTQ